MAMVEIFNIIENGIRFTGMPGSAEVTRDNWKLTLFIRHLPSLSEEERKLMNEINRLEGCHHDPSRVNLRIGLCGPEHWRLPVGGRNGTASPESSREPGGAVGCGSTCGTSSPCSETEERDDLDGKPQTGQGRGMGSGMKCGRDHGR